MQDIEFSDEFCRFIQGAVPTVDAAELLLAVSAQPGVSLNVSELADKVRPTLNLANAEAARYIDVFESRGLIVVGPDKRFQYRPASEELANHVRTLTQAHSERPVTLIRMIYALRDAKIQSFADAFKLKRT
jgi:hypothetical protein